MSNYIDGPKDLAAFLTRKNFERLHLHRRNLTYALVCAALLFVSDWDLCLSGILSVSINNHPTLNQLTSADKLIPMVLSKVRNSFNGMTGIPPPLLLFPDLN